MNDLNVKILEKFGLNEFGSISRIEDKDMWYIDDKYIVKTLNDINRIESILVINTELRRAGVPVVVYNKTITGGLYVEFDNLYYLLMNKASGSHIDYQKEAFPFLFGKNIANLHMGLKNLDGKIPCAEINMDLIEDELRGWILPEITEKKAGIKKEIIDYCVSFNKLYYRLPRQIIHRDLHGGNILFENGEVTAFLDFDITQVNARLFDICYCMDLGVGNTSNENVEQWLETLKKFLSGYNAVSEVKSEELNALPYMFVLIQLLTVAVFLRLKKAKNMIDKHIEYLDWLYDNKNKFLFSRQDIEK